MHPSSSRPWLSVLAASFMLSFADAAKTTVSCSDKACFGQPFEIKCAISGDIASGISWNRPDNIEVVTCNTELHCVSNDESYKVSGRTLRIKKFGEKDLGSWICRDGVNDYTQKCNITTSMKAPEGKLKASCELDDREDQFVSCTGLTSHGSPPAAIRIEHTEVSEQGKAKCSLEGPAAQCMNPTDRTDTVSCPKVTRSGEDTVGLKVFLGIFVVLTVALVIVGVLLWRRVKKEKARRDELLKDRKVLTEERDELKLKLERNADGTRDEKEGLLSEM